MHNKTQGANFDHSTDPIITPDKHRFFHSKLHFHLNVGKLVYKFKLISAAQK